ncbi:agamous-like MADS-box protein MADS9 [Euphorbia lathyris]|uniref:agamous-like MADS-box protein MADS9 n=1 Tax=Euphorbia lathyris TaxID=212925 RepID=UPI0033140568
MGRGKIEIKRIDNPKNRHVTYSKRKNGIIKKAEQISILCDAKVSLLIFGTSGKIHQYCSPSTNLVDLLDNYQKLPDKPRLWDAKHEELSKEIDRIKKENDSMKIKLRHLNGEDISSLHHTELQGIEQVLENGIAVVREKRMECYEITENNTKILEEEHRHLNFYLQQQEMAMEEKKMQKMENPYHHQQHTLNNYNSHMPFAFPVQPIQPNLQDIK